MEHFHSSFPAHHADSPDNRIAEPEDHEECKDDVNNSDPAEESGVVDGVTKEEAQHDEHIGASVAFVDDVDAAEVQRAEVVFFQSDDEEESDEGGETPVGVVRRDLDEVHEADGGESAVEAVCAVVEKKAQTGGASGFASLFAVSVVQNLCGFKIDFGMLVVWCEVIWGLGKIRCVFKSQICILVNF